MRDIICRFMFIIVVSLLVVCAVVHSAFAHALKGVRIEGVAPVALEFSYSTGEAPAYAAIEVYGPDNDKVEFQNGRTDRLGRFSFVPDMPGLWRVVLADNMGHKTEIPVNVQLNENKGVQNQKASEQQSASTGMKALLGVSLLLNIGFFLSWILRRKRV